LGEKASSKIIEQMKNQSEEQKEKTINDLKIKLINTSTQVQDIISNFQKVHEDLIELK
jgi:hypothetical protein